MSLKFELQETIGKYPVIKEIGSGATSRVYLARDPFANREVAIKVFLFAQDTDPQTERMTHKAFVTEASLAGKMNHPHIVDIFDAVVEPDYSYLVMEYVPGVTLEAHSDVDTLLHPQFIEASKREAEDGGKMIARGVIDPSPIASHTLPLEEAPRGYELMAQRTDGALKVLLRP